MYGIIKFPVVSRNFPKDEKMHNTRAVYIHRRSKEGNGGVPN